MSAQQPPSQVTYYVESTRNEPLDPGDGVTVEIVPGVALLRAQAGKLILCDECTQWKWECKTSGGDTWCTKVCAAWNCRELPAELMKALMTP